MCYGCEFCILHCDDVRFFFKLIVFVDDADYVYAAYILYIIFVLLLHVGGLCGVAFVCQSCVDIVLCFGTY